MQFIRACISPEFEDPLIADVIYGEFGGWFEFHEEVAYADSDDTWAKRDFLKSYKRKAKNKRLKGAKLIGYGNSPKPLKIACNYNIPITSSKTQQIENKVNGLVKKLASSKRIAR